MKRLALIALAGLAFGATAAYATVNGRASTHHPATHASGHAASASQQVFRTAPDATPQTAPATSSDQGDDTPGQDDQSQQQDSVEQGDDAPGQDDQSQQQDGSGDQSDGGGASQGGDQSSEGDIGGD